MKEIIFDLLSVGKPAKAFSLNPEVKKADTNQAIPSRYTTEMSIPVFIMYLSVSVKGKEQ